MKSSCPSPLYDGAQRFDAVVEFLFAVVHEISVNANQVFVFQKEIPLKENIALNLLLQSRLNESHQIYHHLEQ